jgi:hypothetical protein
MKNLIKIFKEKKDKIVEKTIEILPNALRGDRVNRMFYINIDKEKNIKVDYIIYLGISETTDNCFMVIKDYETPYLDEHGVDDYDEIDYYANGWKEKIENEIDEHIEYLERIEIWMNDDE